MEAEGFGAAHSNIRITTEISVNLKSKQEYGERDLQTGIFRVCGKNRIDDGGNIVGDHQLIEKAEQDQA